MDHTYILAADGTLPPHDVTTEPELLLIDSFPSIEPTNHPIQSQTPLHQVDYIISAVHHVADHGCVLFCHLSMSVRVMDRSDVCFVCLFFFLGGGSLCLSQGLSVLGVCVSKQNTDRPPAHGYVSP